MQYKCIQLTTTQLSQNTTNLDYISYYWILDDSRFKVEKAINSDPIELKCLPAFMFWDL